MEAFETKAVELNSGRRLKWGCWGFKRHFVMSGLFVAGLVYLLCGYARLRGECNDVMMMQGRLNEKTERIEEAIREMKVKIDSEKDGIEHVRGEIKVTWEKTVKINQAIESTKASIEEQNIVINQLGSSVYQKQERLAVLQRKNTSLKKEIEEQGDLIDSKILINNSDRRLIEDWTGRKLKAVCYSTQFNFSKELMLKGCGNSAPTLLIVKGRDNLIIGGYTTQMWTNVNETADRDAFLFSLSQKHKYTSQSQGFPISFSPETISFGSDFSVHKMTAICNAVLSSKELIIEGGLGLYTENDLIYLSIIEVLTFK